MKNSTKKPVSVEVKKPIKTERKKRARKTEVKTENPVNTQLTVHTKIQKLEVAYMAAISGEMKFGKVKDLFKKLHRDIKKSTKK
jgi:hypothetical protein